MKKIFLMIIILGNLILFTGCEKDKNYIIDIDLAKENLTTYEEFDNCEEMTKEDMESIYDFDTNLLEEYTIMMPKVSNNANMYMILKVKSENQDEVRNMLNNFTDKYIQQFNLYAPEQVDLIDNKVISIKDEYIIYLISNDNKSVLEVIRNSN